MLSVLMALAGKGMRFKEAGYDTWKPMLPVDGKPLLLWALESVKELDAQVTIVTNRDHIDKVKEAVAGEVIENIAQVNNDTRGPLETLMECKEIWEGHEELLVMDGDAFIDAQDLKAAVEAFEDSGAMAGVPVQVSSDPGCSYVKIDTGWWITEAREKDAFTRWSSTGPYWWRNAGTFKTCATAALCDGLMSLAPCFNYTDRVKAYPVDSFMHLGTPEAYEKFIAGIAGIDRSCADV